MLNENVEVEATYKDVDPGHTHNTDTSKWKFDANVHWNACTGCGDHLNEAVHTFTWITDKEATKTETGLKHEECSVCGFKRNENTVIDKLPADGGNTGSGDSGKSDAPKNPQTGDTSNFFGWLTLLFVSAGLVIGTTVYSAKRKIFKAE